MGWEAWDWRGIGVEKPQTGFGDSTKSWQRGGSLKSTGEKTISAFLKASSLSLSLHSFVKWISVHDGESSQQQQPFSFPFFLLFLLLSVRRSIDRSIEFLAASRKEREWTSERASKREGNDNELEKWVENWFRGFFEKLWITLFGSADMDLSLMGVPHNRGASLFSHIRKNKSVSYNFRTKRIGIEAWYRLKNDRRGFLEISSEFLHLDPIAFYYFLFHISSVQCFTHRVFESRRFSRNAWKNLKQGERRRSRWMDAVPGRMLMRARRRFLVVVVPEGQ